jgi:large subunit ribosomal protein L18
VRVRKHVSGTTDRPRLCVFRSERHIYAQLVDDARGVTLAAASSQSPELRASMGRGSSVEAAGAVGRLIGEKAKATGVARAVFDRAGYQYHGRVLAVAEGARAAGLDMGAGFHREDVAQRRAKRRQPKEAPKQPQQRTQQRPQQRSQPQQQRKKKSA